MRRARLHARRGFTLVELMVSLVAGLIIAIAVVGLAKTATTTFYEQARLASTEQSARAASERLRADLLRVGFMATGNVKLANRQVGRSPQGHWVAPQSLTGALQDLAGIRIEPGASQPLAEGANNLSTRNNVSPDAITILGNMTTDDSYRGVWRGSCGGGARIELNADADGAVRRLLSAANPNQAIQNAFVPVAGSQFLARVVDALGCQHFVVVASASAAGTKAEVCVTDTPGILTPPQNNCGAREGYELVINPVQKVRWYVGANVDPVLAPDPAVEDPTGKFNIYRQMLDVADAPAGPPEVVAEYAIDLKFGIVVDDPAAASPADRLQVFDFYTGKDAQIALWTQRARDTNPGLPGPQRVRSVRYRVATRAALPDRAGPLFITTATSPYQPRYCVENQSLATCKRLARVRSISSEVALINQAGMSY